MTTIRYGVNSSINRDFGVEVTVNDLLADKTILGALGAPESVRAISNGETLDGDDYVADYSTITLEKQASSKA